MGLKYLANALRVNKVIKIFSFFASISHIPFMQALTTINLYWNRISVSGVKYLADALRVNTVSNVTLYFPLILLSFVPCRHLLHSISQ